MTDLDEDDLDEPRCRVRSKTNKDSIIPTPSTQDHDPAYMVRVLGHNSSRQEWERLTGMSINEWYQETKMSMELTQMLRHGHRYYHVHMDEYGYVLFNAIFHAGQ